MSQQPSLTVQVSPYVASAIIEHGKRRSVAAGYIMGERTTGEVRILDYYPLTHYGRLADLSSAEYEHERRKGRETKLKFSTLKVIGWYSAGSLPSDLTPQDFRQWCEGPAHSFINHSAIHLHCSLPDKDSIAITWTAARMETRKEEVEKDPTKEPTKTGAKSKATIRTTRAAELPVCVSAMNHEATNVVLDYVASLALYGGKKPYPSSNLLNLDSIAFDTAKLPMPRISNLNQPQLPGQREEPLPQRPMEAALIAVHDKLLAAIKQAKAVAAGSSNASASAEDKKASQELLANYELIRKTKEVELEQQHNAACREDVNTQRFKDALMIKCMTVMLRREVMQVESLAKQYQDPQAQPRSGYTNTRTNNSGMMGLGNRNAA